MKRVDSQFNRRAPRWVAAALCTGMVATVCLPPFGAGAAHAQSYPNKPIRVINTVAAGGPAETVARTVGQKLTEAWGQPVIIDSRPGAGGVLGAEIAVRGTPDGYTLLLGSGATMVFAPLLRPKMPYDPLKDFEHVSMVVLSPMVLVAHPSTGVKSVKDLVAAAQSRPNHFNFGTLGPGSTAQMGVELLKMRTGIDVQQIAYKGGAPAVTALVAGEIHFLFNSLASAIPHVKSGRLTLLGTAGPRRSPLLPDMPTVAETYPGIEVVTWYSMLAPLKTPKPIVQKLNAEIGRALAQRETADRLIQLGHEPLPGPPEALRQFIQSELDRWGKVIKAAGGKS